MKIESPQRRLSVSPITERELDEERRLNSMGAEREYILLGKIAQLEREIDRLNVYLRHLEIDSM